ncbi:uncharacterized protein B0H64DRAFT_440977 [Chaetomium fimeti]|uniref:Uncharacterized protein n=1 Tax=Chaetomium fimeti TaxID=1854472 RepID=A0AAE0HJ29_9PEZI|nr:hypothetical protein B0H64DRAFT_440977 [Chaetomium fimeti]
MFPPLRTALIRASTRQTPPLTHPQLRRYASQPPSPTGAFYKTFTRPVAKCALLAVFVYQLVYFGWAKLETDEIKEERQAEIVKLEAQVRGLQAARTAATAGATTTTDESNGGSGAVGVEKGEGAKSTGGSWWRWK